MERGARVGSNDTDNFFCKRDCASSALGVGFGDCEGRALGLAVCFEELELFVGVVGEAVDGDDGGKIEASHDGDMFFQIGEACFKIARTLIPNRLYRGDEHAAAGLMPELGMTMSMYFSKPRSEAKPVSLTT